MSDLLHSVMHLDDTLGQWASDPRVGLWIYAILFGIVFCETGLVVTPFLPGDSLLFAAGVAATLPDSSLNIWALCGVLLIAAVLGDTVNYHIGRWLGPRVATGRLSRWINPKHLDKTRWFFEKYGAKTIVLARFVPIVRTFAPFVAGIGQMNYGKFLTYNVVGAAVWVLSMTWAGYWLGNIPFVKERFELIVLAIVGVSLLPIVIEFVNNRIARRREAAAPGKGST